MAEKSLNAGRVRSGGWLTVLASEPSVLLAERGSKPWWAMVQGPKTVCPGQQGKVKMGGFEGHFGEEPLHHVSWVK